MRAIEIAVEVANIQVGLVIVAKLMVLEWHQDFLKPPCSFYYFIKPP